MPPNDDRESWPRVTELLKWAGFFADMRGSQEAMDRGTAVHMGCQFVDEGMLRERIAEALTGQPDADEILVRIDSYQRWLKESRMIPSEREVKVYHPTLRYRGTMDGLYFLRDEPWVVDIKSGEWTLAAQIQTALYALAWAETREVVLPSRGALYLRANGTYLFADHTEDDDYDEARRIVSSYYWRVNHGQT